MKDGTLIVQRLARFSHALLARTKRAKVIARFWYGFSEQAHDDAASFGRSFDLDIKEYFAGDLFSRAV
jgi:hypothetical protein